MAAHYAVVSGGGYMPPHKLPDVSRLAALGTWRYTQGIYRVDPSLLDHIASTPIDRDLPCDVLMRLPEWCLYIEAPGILFGGTPIHGFFAHLEWDVQTQRTELRLLIDAADALTPLPLHLGAWPLADAVQKAFAVPTVAAHIGAPPPGMVEATTTGAAQLVNLLLFVLSQVHDIGQPNKRPGNPVPKRIRHGGWQLFAADGPSTWDVGVRMGAALRKAYAAEQMGGQGAAPHSGPRPHVRRAHWHGFWSGSRDPEQSASRKYDVRWLPPIPVNLDDVADLPATIRKVQA